MVLTSVRRTALSLLRVDFVFNGSITTTGWESTNTIVGDWNPVSLGIASDYGASVAVLFSGFPVAGDAISLDNVVVENAQSAQDQVRLSPLLATGGQVLLGTAVTSPMLNASFFRVYSRPTNLNESRLVYSGMSKHVLGITRVARLIF
jgi:hypothetical protein